MGKAGGFEVSNCMMGKLCGSVFVRSLNVQVGWISVWIEDVAMNAGTAGPPPDFPWHPPAPLSAPPHLSFS